MLDDKRFDFSLESDIKEKLWRQMLEKSKPVHVREEISFESLASPSKSSAASEKSGKQAEKITKPPVKNASGFEKTK
ncbi:MAG: hypothetical protein FWH10_05810 [Oscillospiraceae bacterium]|nr:hypothetical protein [Oscillospiraceae bacterium]